MLRPWTLSLINVLAATTLVACGDSGNTTDASAGSTGAATSGATDDPTTTVGTSNATDDATTTPTTTMPPTTSEGTTMVGGDTAADGEACSANDDCASVGCLKWRDLEMGECVPAPAGGNTRIAGTLVDFVAGTPVAGAELRVVGALTVALSPDPATAMPVLTTTSEANGQVDVTSTEPLAEGVGVVGVITGGSFYTTVTGIAAPTAGVYGPMNGNRDIWALPAATLTEWTGYLMTDPEIAPSLPLGDAGGVVGFVRDGNGMGKAGATIISPEKGDMTTAKIRYLSDDGLSFNAIATGPSGIFVLVTPSLAETFMVEGGTAIGTAGSAKKAVFVMILNEP